jgi:hypothetical protein
MRSPQNFRHRKKVSDGLHAQHAAAAKGSLEHFIAAGEGSGVRGCGLCGGLGASSLDHDDGLVERDFARGRQKRAGIQSTSSMEPTDTKR